MDAVLAKTMNVVFRDTFAVAGNPWEIIAGAPTLARDTTDGEWLTDGASLKLTTSVTASQVQEVRRYLDLPAGQRHLAFGGRFAAADENPASIEFSLGFRDGTNYYFTRMIHDFVADTWSYDKGGSGAQSLTSLLTRDLSESTTIARWHEFVVGMNVDAPPKQSIFKVDERDLSGYVAGVAARKTVDATLPGQLDLGIVVTNKGGTPSAGIVFLDELYLLAAAT